MKAIDQGRGRVATACLVLTICIAVLFGAVARAEPVDSGQAMRVVAGWLATEARPFGARAGLQVSGVQTFSDIADEALYYVVELDPAGYVIVPADDCLEPVVCFVQAGDFDPSETRPLGALVGRDIPQRLRAVRELAEAQAQLQGATDDDVSLSQQMAASQLRWSRLSAAAEGAASLTIGSIPDVRVAPFVVSTWGQTTVGDYVGGVSCYNYYTPPGSAGSSSNYPCGCVATAMAQTLRYFEYPDRYVWSNMPLDPDFGITLTQRQAIGDLCYDAARAINTAFGPSGSSATLNDAAEEIKYTFYYSNSIILTGSIATTKRNTILNSNLDAKRPVLMGLDGPDAGHAIVCDGYGYSGSTLYHHLNMGWSGNFNAWYALPVFQAWLSFSTVDSLAYNIYISGSGEIISGRVTDLAGNPIQGAVVQAQTSGYSDFQATSDAAGIYALVNLPSNRSFSVTATKSPHSFPGRNVSTGRSYDYGACGNVAGVDFVSGSASPPSAQNEVASVMAGQSVDIALTATDDGLPNPPGTITYIISSLPSHGGLSDPITGPITAVPYVLANHGSTVTYHSCSYYAGDDFFDYCADDGGTAPTGGSSPLAQVAVTVENTQVTTFAPDSGYVARWPLRTGYHDSRTQVIYLSSEIGAAKNITALALDITTIPARTAYNWTIRIKHTNMSSYGYWDGFQTDGWTTVLRDDVTVDSLGWWNFEFQTPFEYNGVSNLMIDFSHESDDWASPSGECSVSPMGAERVVMAYADSTHGDPLNWSEFYVPDDYYGSEGVPNIRIISTVQADPIVGDFGVNCSVDAPDLATLASAWMTQPGDIDWDADCDISTLKDNIINQKDFAVFADKWLNSSD